MHTQILKTNTVVWRVSKLRLYIIIGWGTYMHQIGSFNLTSYDKSLATFIIINSIDGWIYAAKLRWLFIVTMAFIIGSEQMQFLYRESIVRLATFYLTLPVDEAAVVIAHGSDNNDIRAGAKLFVLVIHFFFFL